MNDDIEQDLIERHHHRGVHRRGALRMKLRDVYCEAPDARITTGEESLCFWESTPDVPFAIPVRDVFYRPVLVAARKGTIRATWRDLLWILWVREGVSVEDLMDEQIVGPWPHIGEVFQPKGEQRGAMKTWILFHGKHCRDGFAAAVVARKALEEQGLEASYHSMAYGDPMPDIPNGSTVYFLDYSRPRAELLELARRCRVVVLDHHKTAQDDLRDRDDISYEDLRVTFDMEKSGAVLTWEHFYPDEPVPELLLYVQDRDLWRHELPGSREINARLQSMPMDWKRWRILLEMSIDDEEEDSTVRGMLWKQGTAVLEQIETDVDLVAQNASLACMQLPNDEGYYNVVAVNCPLRQSDLLDRLCREREWEAADFAVSYWRLKDGRWQFSLRSRGDFDVSEVAKAFGGGGHKNAAGFTVDRLDDVF